MKPRTIRGQATVLSTTVSSVTVMSAILLSLMVLGGHLGCGSKVSDAAGTTQTPGAEREVDSGQTQSAGSEPAAQREEQVPDLRSRKTGDDWPRFLGPTQDGKSSETGIRTDWSAGLPVVWQLELGEGYSAPTTSKGRIFIFDRLGNNIRLRALTSEGGDELWSSTYPTDYEDMYNYSGGPRTSPVVDEGRVYAYGPEGRLRCHRVVDGELCWELDTQKAYGVKQNFFGVGSTPAIHGDLLITQIGGSPADSSGIQSGSAQSNGTGIVAFDKFTGEERYRLADELASYASIRVAKIDGRAQAFGFTRGGLVGFEPGSGKQSFFFPWRAKKLESVNAATPVVIGDRVFITESYGRGGALLRVAGGEAKVIWQDERRKKSIESHWATPIHVDGVLYGCSGQSTGNAQLRAVSLESGQVLWKQPGLGRTTLLLVEDHFVVLGEYGEMLLVKVDPESYQEVTRWTPIGEVDQPLVAFPAWNGPILSHGLLYVRGKDRLLALELIPG